MDNFRFTITMIVMMFLLFCANVFQKYRMYKETNRYPKHTDYAVFYEAVKNELNFTLFAGRFFIPATMFIDVIIYIFKNA